MDWFKKSDKKPAQIHQEEKNFICCPFCNKSFHVDDVRFRFEINNEIEYYSIKPLSEGWNRLIQLCEKEKLDSKIITTDGVPMKLKLLDRSTKMVQYASPVRVCNNEKCNQVLSKNAGFYTPGNGIFFLGWKGSGKTVMITTLIEVLKERAGKFHCHLTAYNKMVREEYEKDYYNAMYKEKKLPNATIVHNQLVYEWVNTTSKKVADITFSDIKGEATDDVQKIFSGEMGKAIEKSRSFVVAVDLEEIIKNKSSKEKTIAIFREVLSMAVSNDDEKSKYLAVVLTKSDTLANQYGSEILQRRGVEHTSPIFAQLDYDNPGFELIGRAEINEGIRKLLLRENCKELIDAAEHVFGEHVNYFAVSSLGCAPKSGTLSSEKPMPIRVEEPILWLLKKMELI